MTKIELDFARKINECFEDVTYLKGYAGMRSSNKVHLICNKCSHVNLRATTTVNCYYRKGETLMCDNCKYRHRGKILVKNKLKINIPNQDMKHKDITDMDTFERNFMNKTNEIQDNLTYVSGYDNENSEVFLKCGLCDYIGQRKAKSTKQYRIGRTHYKCDGCEHIHETYLRETQCVDCDKPMNTRVIKPQCSKCSTKALLMEKKIKLDEEEKRKEMIKIINKELRLIKSKKKRIRSVIYKAVINNSDKHSECGKCLKTFSYKGVGKRTVCTECKVTNQNRLLYKKDKKRRRLMRSNGEYDNSIDLDSVIERYNNECYLCLEQCDREDHEWKSGVFYTGNRYPSVEHVIPISKGGTHTWDNVNLACMYCNAIKGDT